MNEKELNARHEEIRTLFSQVFALTARALEKVAEFDAQQGWAQMHYQSMSHYLNFAVGISMGTAREHVRVANALQELPLIKAAFSAGTLSYSKVRALTRIATAETEESYLNVANHATGAQLEQIVRGCRRITGEQSKQQVQDRCVDMAFDEEGMFFLRARLLPDEGARVMAAIGHKDRADKLMTLLSGEGSTTELIVHVEGDACQVEARGELVAVPAGTAQRAACDASVVTMVHDKEGNVLDVGRRSRKIPAGMRRALATRDQGCRYPGCPNKLVDAHHIKSWSAGGETKLENLLELCRFHHRQLHEGGYSMAFDKEGKVQFSAPRPAPLPTAGNLQVSSAPWKGVDWTWREFDPSYVTSTLVNR